MGKAPYERCETPTRSLRSACERHASCGLTQAQTAALSEKTPPRFSRCEPGNWWVDAVKILLFAMADNQPQPSKYFTDGVLQSKPRRKRNQG